MRTRCYRGRSRSAGNGAALDLNFLKGVIDPRLLIVNPSSRTYFDNAGVLQSSPANTWPLTYDPVTLQPVGRLLQPQRTNLIRNNMMVGASVGAFPTSGWATAWPTGITWSVVAIGSEKGAPYIDCRCVGTNNQGSTAYPGIFFDNSVPSVAANSAYTTSAFMSVVAGALPAGVMELGCYELTSAGAFIRTSSSTVAVNSTASQKQATFTTQATTGRLSAQTFFVLANGASVDVTIRFRLPQLEQGPTATMPIFTAGAQATRYATSIIMPPEFATAIVSGSPLAVVAEYAILGLTATNQFIVDITNGSISEELGIFEADSSFQVIRQKNNVNRGQPFVSVSQALGTVVRSAFGVSTNAFIGSRNGVSLTAPAGADPLPTVNQIRIGARTNNTFDCNIAMRRLTIYRRESTQAQFNAMTAL